MSNIITVNKFLMDKMFSIPTYQRDYAWTITQVDDLMSDIHDALVEKSTHYLGTLVLACIRNQSFEIVDGQQRLSTLTLVIRALLNELDPNGRYRIVNEDNLLGAKPNLRLDFGKNQGFVDDMFSGKQAIPATLGQRKLLKAFNFATERARNLKRQDQDGERLVKEWIDTIKSLEIIEFVATDTGRAIRMFQTVNDRGVPLTYIDKAKALLVYFSNRYLNGKLDSKISDAFGQCFSAFDSLKEFVSKTGYRIDNIARDTFTEDDILRYHYLAYHNDDALNVTDYDGTVRTVVFEGFLKGTLKSLCQQPIKLESFINDYVDDLSQFAQAFEGLITGAEKNSRLYKVFIVLGLSARLYPLVIRLFQRDLLFHATAQNNGIDLLHCIEVCDVRIYKTRGTDPAKDIGSISHGSQKSCSNDIAQRINEFTKRFMPDSIFQNSLSQDMYHNGALLHILLWHDEQVANCEYSLEKIFDMTVNQMTREHILSQTPNWSVCEQGFLDDADFESHLHTIGNLTLLSGSENSKCQNQPAYTKMTPGFYGSSIYAATRQLAHKYGPTSEQFDKDALINRTNDIVAAVMNRWAICN